VRGGDYNGFDRWSSGPQQQILFFVAQEPCPGIPPPLHSQAEYLTKHGGIPVDGRGDLSLPYLVCLEGLGILHAYICRSLSAEAGVEKLDVGEAALC
jgi:hypothetical protein